MLLIVQSLFLEGDRLEAWADPRAGLRARRPSLRLCRLPSDSWGLVVAGPLAVIISSLADTDTRPAEIAVFAVVMTLLCGLLFKELLNLPIPFDPAGLIPDPVNSAYVGVKSAIGQAFAGMKSLIVR